MLTAITEITRNASTASRGLKQVSSRLTQVLDDSSATGKKLTEIYDGLGIALKDSEGQIRSTYDILADLAEQWDNLSKTISWTIENEDYRKVQFEDIISIPVSELKNRRFAFCFVGEDKEKILRITTNFLTVDLR